MFLTGKHLQKFRKLFPHQPIIFKQHRIIHYPTVLQQSGPFIHQCVLKYERKHQFFKRLAHQVCNFKNICKTMVDRHQLEQYVHWSSSDDSLANEFGPGKVVPCEIIFSKENVKFLAENFNLVENVVYECKRAKTLEIWFKIFDVIIINYNPSTDMPVFLKIEKILRVVNQLVFFGYTLEIFKYSNTSRSYLTTETPVTKFVSYNSLFDYNCYSIHLCFDQKCIYGHIVLRNKLLFNNFASLLTNA